MAGRDGHNLLEGALRLASASGLSHPARLGSLLRHLADALGASASTVFLPSPEGDFLSRYISSNNPDLPQQCTIPFGAGGAGRCALSRTFFTAEAADLHPEEPREPDERYFHLFPVHDDRGVLGAVTVASGETPLDDAAIKLVEGYLPIVSLVLEGMRLAEAASSGRYWGDLAERDKQVKELSLLFRMSNTMLSTIKLNELIHLTLTALTSGPIPLFDRAMLFLTNERSGMLLGMLGATTKTSPSLYSLPEKGGAILASRWNITEEEMLSQRDSDFSRWVRGSRLELSDTLNAASRAVLEKRLIYVPHLEGAPIAPVEPPLTSFAVSPLIAHGQVVGVVIVDNALTGTGITQEDLRFLQLFTNQAGMAIENSMLYNKIEETNRQLCEAQEHLLQKERLAAIGEVATGIAHELKSPLVAIGGFARRLSRKVAAGSPESEQADLIVREVIRLERVLSEILLFAKKATICYTDCDVTEIVKESLAVVASSLEEHWIQVTTQFSAEHLLLVGDNQQLKQVFINLFMNAVEAMSSGGKLSIRSERCELEGKGAVCVTVGDTGGGIPLESLNNIFTPFYTTKQRGTGLGLPIANRIITNHGGKVILKNQPGIGVEFKIVLPVSG